ncbi:LysM peptidoglycan-binding domain-containing protein [Dyella caseinilytica]|uniref:LysM peptidoglycan-binding domain-containing protein n=1 Tax=Dyella caseinilytica TaxID=1849581 RepID=A0ABX7GPR6_9GAMM|nr:DUF6531 domain-containing protein [Dyella caseinilytica]QRN52051.1 LysM peptidoglycan-binding domain-containing protein [Dyella caseinilytica]
MVAVISGNGLGLGNTSLTQLGQTQGGSPQLGQAANSSYVNTATGNLVLQSADEGLLFDGLPLNVLRTYNSLGQLSGNGWSYGFSRNLNGLTGTVNTAGSTITRTDDDGSSVVYTYNATLGEYVSTDQSGAVDTLSYNATSASWTWTDAADSQQETYNANGQLTALTDTATGASYSFSYSNGQLSQIVAGDGDTLIFGYNTSNQLISLSIQEVPPGQTSAVTRQAVTYGYDSQGRLSTVTTSLGSDTDSTTASYTTTYTYQGTTDLVASVTQSDGTTVSYTYTEDAQGVYQVTGVTTGSGAAAQSVTLSYGTDSTTVTDGLGNVTQYQTNAAGELTSVIAPAVNGVSPTTTYTYDTSGNLLTSTDPDGAVTSYSYDANGNLLSVEDGAGNTVSYTYNANDQVTSKTTYTVPAQGEVGQSGYVAPSGAQTTYYVYTANDQLAYTVDPLGNVSENDYITVNGLSELTTSRQYLGATYSTSSNSNSPSSPPTLAELQAWVQSGAVQSTLSQSTRTDYTYDARGQLATQTQYDTVNSSGVGVVDAGTVITTTTYSAQGQLLQTSTETGADFTTLQTTSYAYDGLGRVISKTDPLGNVTSYVYTDSANTIAITQANGLTTTQVRNSAGLLVSSTQSGTEQTSEVSSYLYNADGEQIAAIDPDGNVTYTFYNADGEVTGTVDGAGHVTAYTYDADGHVLSTTQYATPIASSTLSGWLSNGALTSSYPASLPIPASTANDRITTSIYNAAGEVVATIDPAGNVTTTSYNGAGEVLSTTQYATPLSSTLRSALGSAPTLTELQNDLSSNAANRTALTIYDADGHAVATIDASGYVTVTTYNAAGDAALSTAYATALTPSQLSNLGDTPTLAVLQADLTASAQDQTARTYYDGDGRVVASIDADGYLTTTAYDETTNTVTTTRYATALTSTQLAALTGTETVATLVGLLGGNTANETSSATTNADGQVVSKTAVDGTVTTYTYNAAGQVLSTTVTPTSGQGAARTTSATYDAFGDELTATDAAGKTTTYQYNVLGQQVEATDPDGNSIWSYYDADGTLLYTIQGQPSGSTLNAQGNVTAYAYNAFGEVVSTTTYAAPLTLITSGTNSGTTIDPTGATVVQVASAIAALSAISGDANATTSTTYTLDGQVATVTNGDGYQTASTYGAFGDVLSVQQQLSQPGSALSSTNSTLTDYTYDNRGEQLSETDGVGSSVARTTSITYDAFGRVTSTTDGNGNTLTYSYDNLGRQVSTSQTVQGSARTTQTTYDAFGHVLTQTDALGNTTTYSYNVATHTTTLTTPDGLTTTTVKDAYGDTVSVTDAGGNTTTYTYDADGRLLTTTTPLGEVSTDQYDADGDLIQTTDATGHVVTYTYNASGKVLTQTVDPNGLNLTTSYRYDAQGRTLSITDPTGAVTTTTYDADGNQLTQTNAVGDVTSYTYDGDGKTLTVTTGAGTSAAVTTQYVYDNLERLSQTIVNPGSLNLTSSYSYDANNNLIASTDANGNVTRYVYDQADEKIFTIDPTGAVTQSTYDADGRLTATRTYATTLTASQLSALGSTPTIAAVTADLTTSPSDSYTQSVYNADGQVIYTLSGTTLNVTQYTYNNAGQVTQTRQVATALSSTNVSQTATSSAIASLVTTSANDLVTTTVYNADGEAVYTINGDGAVTQTTYDAAGRITQTTAYATELTPAQLASLGSTPTTAQVAALITPSANDRRTTTSYDTAGRAVDTINALGTVTQTTYDADGRVTSTHVYATALTTSQLTSLGANPTPAQISALVTAGSADQVSYTVYDAAGEPRYSIDPMGYVKETRYNAAGQVIETLAYANAISTASETSALQAGTALSWVSGQVGGTSGTNPDSSAEATLTLYDAAGRQVFTVQQNDGGTVGQVTGYSYDANGNVTSQTAYGSTLALSTSESLSAQLTTASVTSAVASITHEETTTTVYDGDNRALYTINALGNVAQNSYDGVGRLIETQQYATPITLPATINASTIAAAVTAAGGGTGERLTSTTYNSQGQVLTTSDAQGVNATYTYNTLDQKISDTNRDGDTSHYSYDSAGRLIQTQSPPVTVGSYNTSTGTLQSSTSQYLYTTNTYDAFGDVLSTSQGYGTSTSSITNASTTTYVYDALGHTLQTTNALGHSTSTIYNALGQAVVSTDANGNHSYSVYNADGQLIDSVDGNGYVTATTYDAYGNVLTTTQYATALSTSAITGWSAGEPLTAAQLQQGLVTSSSDRTTTTTYNELNQKTQVVQPTISYVLSMGPLAGSVTTGSPTTTYTYDAYGNVISTAQLVQGALTSGSTTSPAIWETSYTYYDALNRAVMVVTPTGSTSNPQGYVTTTSYTTFGQVSSSTQYAQAISTSGITTTTPPALPGAATQVSGANRVTTYTYDAIGRVSTEVDAGGYNANTGYTTNNIGISYTYNGENQVLTKTVNGATTTTQYDALGRVISVTAPAREALVSNWQSILENTPSDDLTTSSLYTSVSPVTTYVYDALGDTVSTTVSGGGLTQQSYGVYNALGEQTESIDADGNVHNTTYDANGNVLTTSYLLTAGVTVTTTNTYDADNQLLSTAVQRSNATTNDSYTQQKYNAFGEAIAKGDGNASGANGGYEALYTYNNAGQQTSSPNTTTGAIHTYAYDLVGNLVLDTSTVTGSSATAYTENTYNLGNQAITQLTPTTNAATGENSGAVSKSYDRWGNVISETDANGNVTTYQYDSQNHLIEETEADVLVVSATGVYTWTQPTETWAYNVNGELTQSTDANGNVTTYSYDAAGNQTVVEDGTDAITYTGYDALGRAVATETPPVQNSASTTVNNITTTTYNNLNQVTGQGYFQPNSGGTARTQVAQETYVLNANGDRLQTTDALGNTITYTYDSQHRVLTSTTPLNETTTYVYDINGNLIHETDADGNTQSWVYNYFGQVQSHVDESNATYTYTYDANSGLLTQETSNWNGTSTPSAITSTLTYSYEAGGQMAGLTEVVGTGSSAVTSTYGYDYDANGNETLETASTKDGGGNSVDTQTVITYDTHNRIEEVTVENISGSTPVATMRTAYVYDADGNRRAVFASSAYDTDGVAATAIPLDNNPATNITVPTLNTALANQTVTQSGTGFAALSYSVAGNFTDPLGMGLTYTATGLPNWLSINSSTGTVSGTPPVPTAPTSYTITVTAMDVLGNSVSDSFTVTVPTLAPVFNSTPAAQTAQPGAAWSYVAPAATDLNGYGVTYSASGMPPGISFNAATRTFSGTPTTGGPYTVTYTATPSTGSATSTTFTITVPNVAPVFSGSASTQTLQPGASLSYQAPAATDANGYSITYSASGLPGGISFNASTRTFSGSLTTNGMYTVTYTATSSAGTAVSQTFDITVPAVTPVFSSGMANQTAMTTVAMTSYTAPAATDANGASITYSASGMPSGVSFNASTRVFSGTPSTAGTYTITYKATASTGTVASATFTITVNAASPPTYNSGSIGTISLTAAQNWFMPSNAFSNPTGRALTYTMTTNPNTPPGNFPDFMTFNSTTGEISCPSSAPDVVASPLQAGVASPMQAPPGGGGSHEVTEYFYPLLTATDPVDGLSVSISVTIAYSYMSDSDAVSASSVAQAATPSPAPSAAVTATPAATPAPSSTPNVQADWFTYDADSRVLVADGSLQNAGQSNAQIVINDTNTNSGENTYDAAGDVIQYTSLNSSNAQTIQKNYYTAQGQLTTVYSTAPSGTTFGEYESRSYDLDGRLTQDVIFNAPGSTEAADNSSGTLVTYSDAGWVRTDTVYTYNADGELADQSEYAEDSAQNLINAYGSNVDTSIYESEDQSAPTSLPTVGAAMDGSALYLYSENSYTASTGYGYDADGSVLGYHTITGSSGTILNADPTGGTVGYQNTYVEQNGLLLSTTIQVPTSGSNTVTTSNTYNDLGELAATTGLVNGATQTQDLAYTAGGQILQKSATSNGTTTTTYYESVNEQQLGSTTTAGAINVLSTTGGYSNSTTGTQSYTVQAGDTLQSLAQEIYGDSNYYYILAQANGLSPTATLTAGMVLHIPQVTTAANAYNTYQPYSASNAVSGSAAGLETLADMVALSIDAMFNQQSAIAQTVAQIEAQEQQAAQAQEQAEQAATNLSQQAKAKNAAQQAVTTAAQAVETAQVQAAAAEQAAVNAQQQAADAQADAATAKAGEQQAQAALENAEPDAFLAALGKEQGINEIATHGTAQAALNAYYVEMESNEQRLIFDRYGGLGGPVGGISLDISYESPDMAYSSLPPPGTTTYSSQYYTLPSGGGVTNDNSAANGSGNSGSSGSSSGSGTSGGSNDPDMSYLTGGWDGDLSNYSLATAGTGVGDGGSDLDDGDWWNNLGGLSSQIDPATLAQWQGLGDTYQSDSTQYTDLETQYTNDETSYNLLSGTATLDQSLYQTAQTDDATAQTDYQTAQADYQTANDQAAQANADVQQAQAQVAQSDAQLGQESDTGGTLPSIATSVDVSGDLTIQPTALSVSDGSSDVLDNMPTVDVPADTSASLAGVTGSAETTAWSAGQSSSTYSSTGSVLSTSTQTYTDANGQPGLYNSQTGQYDSLNGLDVTNLEGLTVTPSGSGAVDDSGGSNVDVAFNLGVSSQDPYSSGSALNPLPSLTLPPESTPSVIDPLTGDYGPMPTVEDSTPSLLAQQAQQNQLNGLGLFLYGTSLPSLFAGESEAPDVVTLDANGQVVPNPVVPNAGAAGGANPANAVELSPVTVTANVPPGAEGVELPAQGSLSNVDARNWYLNQESQIPSMLDTSQSLENQANQAWALRNYFRTGARDAMADQDLAQQLMETNPNMTWDQTVQKYSGQYSGDEVWQQIINASQRSNPGVNQSLGVTPPGSNP